MPYVLTAEAEEQFARILYDIAVHSGWPRSMRAEDELIAGFEAIASNPGIGHRRSDLVSRGIYFYFANPFLILFLKEEAQVTVIGIYHSARDIAALLA